MKERIRINAAKSAIEAGFAESGITTRILWITGFAVLTAAAARIEIPNQPVPYTLQTFAVLLAGGILGMRNGFLSQTAYLLMGCAGLPVFAGGNAGPAAILGPTGGYLLAFPVAASIIGWLTRQRTGFLWNLFALGVGLVSIFTLGTLQLNLVYFHDPAGAVKAGFVIFSWFDCAKLLAAAAVITALRNGRKNSRD